MDAGKDAEKKVSEGENLTKVHVDLPNHWATGGEFIWAVDLSGDLYEIRNVPFYAYDLNYGDVVRATSDTSDLIPEVKEVVRRSGHNTLRLFFKESVDQSRSLELLATLRLLSASYEGLNNFYFALDLEPEAGVAEVRDVLDIWEKHGLIEYETCEARIQGGFDAAPERDLEDT